MAQGLIPLSLEQQLQSLPYGERIPGYTQVIYFTMNPEMVEQVLAMIMGWFEGCDYVRLADHGTTDKIGLGLIALEFVEYEVNPLFAAILRDEQGFTDYTVYTREGI